MHMDKLEYLHQQQTAHKRACDLGVTHCVQCGYCCLFKPCTLLPNEVKPIADFLGLSIKKLIKTYLVIDKCNKSNHFLRVARETQMDLLGRFVPWDRTYDKGYCCFFDQETHNCKIYPVRPTEAKHLECWTGHSQDIASAYKWKKEDILKFIRNFKEKQ